MFVDVIFLELFNYFTLLFCLFDPLEEFGSIGYKFNIIDEVDGILDILCYLRDIGRDKKIWLIVDNNRANEVIKFYNMRKGNLIDLTLIILF